MGDARCPAGCPARPVPGPVPKAMGVREFLCSLKICGIQLLEPAYASPCPWIQLTPEVYHFLDIILGISFGILPFIILKIGSRAFWIAMANIIIHDLSHFNTDFGSVRIKWLQRMTTKKFPLWMHTPIDVMFVLVLIWTTFFEDEDSGMTEVGQYIYYVFFGIGWVLVFFIFFYLSPWWGKQTRPPTDKNASLGQPIEGSVGG